MTKVSFFAICGLFMILISSCKDRDKNAISEQLNDLYGEKKSNSFIKTDM